MRSAKLPEKLAFALGLLASSALASGCVGDHHVSPWGPQGPSLAAFLRPPDLPSQLARVEKEMRVLRMVRTQEISADLHRPGGSAPRPDGSGPAAVVWGYEGRDVAGRPVHAVRVATGWGVVLAAGPLDAGDLDRSAPTELVPELAAGAYRSGTDLTGDGAMDVVLRNDAGEISVWRVTERGSGPYLVHMAAPPTRGMDVDGDGRVDLWGQRPVPPGDPIAPRLTDVATFAAGAYSDGSPGARAWQQSEASAPLPTRVSDAVRLRAAVEHAWHAILAGEPRESVMRALSREPVPPALRASFEGYERALSSLVAPGPR